VSLLSTTLYPTISLTKNKDSSVSQYKYSHVNWIILPPNESLRLNIASVVGRLDRYTHSPHVSHWTSLEKFLKYLKGIIDYAIHTAFPTTLKGHSDAN